MERMVRRCIERSAYHIVSKSGPLTKKARTLGDDPGLTARRFLGYFFSNLNDSCFVQRSAMINHQNRRLTWLRSYRCLAHNWISIDDREYLSPPPWIYRYIRYSSHTPTGSWSTLCSLLFERSLQCMYPHVTCCPSMTDVP